MPNKYAYSSLPWSSPGPSLPSHLPKWLPCRWLALPWDRSRASPQGCGLEGLCGAGPAHSPHLLLLQVLVGVGAGRPQPRKQVGFADGDELPVGGQEFDGRCEWPEDSPSLPPPPGSPPLNPSPSLETSTGPLRLGLRRAPIIFGGGKEQLF